MTDHGDKTGTDTSRWNDYLCWTIAILTVIAAVLVVIQELAR